MQRTLLFYDLILNESLQINFLNKNATTLKDKVKQLSENAKEDDLLYTNGSVIIQIEDFDENYIFGSYGKAENLSKRKLTRGRVKEDYTVTDLNSLKELVESYTYFYLDININECVILNNANCGAFKTEFPKFLLHHFRVSSIYKSIEISNKLSEKIGEDIGKSNHFASISYSYTSEKLPANEFAGFRELSGLTKDQIKTASVQLYLEPGFDYTESANILANTSKYIDDFSTFKIDTQEETINVIEKILSKKVSINIDEDDIDNLGKIKKILSENLISH